MTIKFMKKALIGAVVVFLIAAGVFTAYRLKNPATQVNPEQSQQVQTDAPSRVTVTPAPTSVRGSVDVDEHGCLTSDGYRYCEPKSRCIKPWEEKCYTSVEEEIQYILANKYDKPADQVNISITKQSGNYVGGSVLFGEGGPGEGGMFLARKVDDVWEVVFDGNGDVDCSKMRQAYGFPDSVLVPDFCD